MNKKYKIADFIDQELPPEILDQLKIVGRVKQYLKPTSTSAISSTEDQQIAKNATDYQNTLGGVEDEISKLIDDVKSFEEQVEQLEDLVDEHLKDMAIPPANDMVAEAVNQLGGANGVITQPILNKAIAILDYFPMMNLGQDPVLASLIGDGSLDGPYLNCNEITSAVGKQIKLAKVGDLPPENALKDQSLKIADNHDKRMKNMMLEIILNLWWNVLWTKFVVDLTIINPIRQTVATPSDSLICFFKKMCGKSRFRRKSKECIQGTEDKGYSNANGPMNKLLNKLRRFLLCKLPPKFYKNYKPYVEIDCKNNDSDKCGPEKQEVDFSGKKNLSDLGDIMDDISDNGPCFNIDDLASGANSGQPTGFGCPPECAKAAKIVLDAVIADALTPPEGTPDPIRNNILGTGAI